MKPSAITDDQINRMRQLRAEKLSYERIAEMLGVGSETVRRHISPKFRETPHRPRSAPSRIYVVREELGLTQAEYRAARRRIPEDTRDLTGQLFGDPLPGRSALDQRQGA
jgi:DNA-binding CsgD family transcriptional regulator